MTSDIHELDVVALTVDLPEEHLVRGQVGTIVHIHTPDVFEVEFSDLSGEPYAQLPISAEKLMRLHHRPANAA